MVRFVVLCLLLCCCAPLVVSAAGAEAEGGGNPFFEDWDTPFGVPPFEQIQTSSYLPAFAAAMAARRDEIKTITSSPQPATFENTIEAFERSGRLLQKVSGVFSNLRSAENSPELQAIAQEVTPKLAALRDDALLDPKLFERVRAVWEARDRLELSREQERLLEETYRDFVRGGAALAPEAQKRLREINLEMSTLGLEFGDNLLAATNAYQLVIKDKADLAGLSEATITAAAEAAAKAGIEGAWVFTLQAPSIWPFLQSSERRELRQQLLDAYVSRCERESEHDTTEVLARLAALRAEKAQLLGYKTWAHYVLEERMAERPEQVYALLWKVWMPALAVAAKEAEELRELSRADGHELEAADWRYYAERVREQRFALDDDVVRPYFQLEKVRDGAFWVAHRLYGIEMIARDDIPTYHPDVKAFEVRDRDGSHLGVLMLDYFPRPGKRGGAWSSTFRGQWVEDGREVRPVVVNVGNFTRPTGDVPALLSLEEVETLFHELGHAMHQLLSRCHYRSLSGSSVPRDFVELPSQIMENWLWQPEVLKEYARHWRTGEVIPSELVERILKARQFNQGFANVEYLAASFLDMDWHTLTTTTPQDAVAFEHQSLTRIGLPDEIVVRYRSPYFAHIFGGSDGYSSGYYSYLWSEVLDADAFQMFRQRGIFDPDTAASFRTNILERGSTEEPMVLYTRFRGREPRPDAMLERKGLSED